MPTTDELGPNSPIRHLLEEIHRRHADDDSGEVASYIPELATADPGLFGIAMVTAGGAVYEVGDSRHEFTIQSISKPFTYALALETVGPEGVRRHVGVEPTGEAFNSITLQPETGLPLNPMVNAGALATAGLIEPLGFERPIDRILNEYSAFAGRDLSIDERVFESENATGHRNRAIAYLLKGSGAIGADDVEGVAETYFRQCSTLVDCRDLAVMAATLASTGVNPVTGERVLRASTVRDVLSVMSTCGMYDEAGEWMYAVGLPAKSGVAGGVIAVLPGQLGIAIYSPALDPHGNSVRGVAVCKEVSHRFRLHVMQPGRRPAPPIRAVQSCADSNSRRLRPEDEAALLARHGAAGQVLELQGELNFGAGELITAAVASRPEGEGRFLVLDFQAVRSVEPLVVEVLSHAIEVAAEAGREVAFSSLESRPELRDGLSRLRADAGLDPIVELTDLDAALEWCEDRILSEYGEPQRRPEVGLAQHPVTMGMSPDQIDALSRLLTRREFASGDLIAAPGAVADRLFMITSGDVSLLAGDGAGGMTRLVTMSAGMTLGEVAMLAERPLLGTPRADTEVTGWELTRADFERLRQEDPGLIATMLENLLRQVATRAAGMRRELIRD